MSWSYVSSFSSIASVTYRGTTYTTSTKIAAYGMIGGGQFGNTFGVRVGSVDVDIAEMIAAGIIICGSAGNYYQTIDVPGGLDYDNYYTNTSGSSTYYMRGGSPPSAPGVICVGNVSTIADTPEEKSGSSESGPRVDIWAPGTNIVSTTSDTNDYGATTQYPFNASYKIMSISGTSMASPNVAGIAAQLLQLHPDYTPAQIRDLIIADSTADMLYTTGLSTDYANTRSLHGGPNRFAYMPYNISYDFVVSGAITMNNVTINT